MTNSPDLVTNLMKTMLLITLIDKIRPGAKRACVGEVRGRGIGIVPFWDVDFPGPGSGAWDPLGEDAVDKEFLFPRARKGKARLVVDEKKMGC